MKEEKNKAEVKQDELACLGIDALMVLSACSQSVDLYTFSGEG
ncbi:hypothetical protein [Paenibacillus sp. D9]|nr:hypothetical protein [Paenibacillus sp. D9]